MKVKELINKLQNFNDNADIIIVNKKNKGYCIQEVMPNYILKDNNIVTNLDLCLIYIKD